jgi:hypothetical protein
MEIVYGVGVLLIIFLLVIILGLQIQITGIGRRLDELADRFEKAQQEMKSSNGSRRG